MARLAARITSDTKAREVIVTGDKKLTIGVIARNKCTATIEVDHEGYLRIWHDGQRYWTNAEKKETKNATR